MAAYYDRSTGRVTFRDVAEFLEEYDRNLRHKGLQVETDDPPPLLDRLSVLLALPDGRDLAVEAEVVGVAGTLVSLALYPSPLADEKLAAEAVRLLSGGAAFAPGKVTQELRKPVTGRIELHDVAPTFEGGIVRPFSLVDLEEALVERPTDAGELRTTTLVRVLRYLARRKLTGKLIVEGEAQRKQVYVFAGSPSSIVSDPERPAERVGQLLVRMGRLEETRLEQVLAQARDTGHRFGRVAVDLGLLTEEQLASLLHFQVEVRLRDLLEWPEAAFRFSAGRDAALEEEAHPVHLGNFLARHVVRYLDERTMEELLAVLGGDAERYVRLRGLPEQEALLDPNQRPLVERLLDPERRVRDLIESSPLGRRPTLRLIVLLRAAGAIEMRSVPLSQSRTDLPVAVVNGNGHKN